MNSSILNSKKKRRSSSKFLITNKQAKLLMNRKCRRVNLLDRNRHINENDLNDLSTNEEPINNDSIKIEQTEPENEFNLALTESISIKTNDEAIKTIAPISKLSELKTKFTNFKNNLVKSISNMKKPPSGSNFNMKHEKKEKNIATNHSSSSLIHPISRQTSRKQLIMPLNEDLNPKTINEQHKRLQGNSLVRSTSVTTIKYNTNHAKTLNNANSNTSSKTNIIKQMRKFDSTSTCTLSTSSNSLHRQESKENSKPVFNQYSKITYNDKYLFQHSSPTYKKVELRRILAQKHFSSSQSQLDMNE